MGAAGRRRRVRRSPGRACRAARRFGGVDHDRARARRGHGVGAAAIPVPRDRRAHPPPRDPVRALRAAHRAAARRPRSSSRPSSSPTACSPSRFAGRKAHEHQSALQRTTRTGRAPPAPRPASATASKPLPEDALIVIPMRNTVLFPGVISPDHGRARELGRGRAGSGAQREARSASSCSATRRRTTCSPSDLYWVGTAGQVVRYITGAEGRAPPRGAGPERASACSSSSRAGRSSWRASQHGRSRTKTDLARDRGALPAAQGSRRSRRSSCCPTRPRSSRSWCRA